MIRSLLSTHRLGTASLLFAVYLAGDLLLPIARFGHLADQSEAFSRVLGNALPYGPWLNRATLLGPLVLVIAVVIAWRRRRWGKLHALDTPIALWVLTPTLVGIANDSPLTTDLMQSLYLALTWGAPYVAGRLVYQGRDDLWETLKVIVGFGAISLVAALLEFSFGRFWYDVFYGFHPFYTQGVTRYWGYRPLLMFEDPNQIAMWWATVALAAWTLLSAGRLDAGGLGGGGLGGGGLAPRSQWMPRFVQVVLLTPPFLFQAVGAACLSVFGAVLLSVRRKRVVVASLAAIVLITAGLLVFRGPMLRYGRQLSESTPAGQAVKAVLRNSSIGSLGWRLGLEEANESLLKQRIWFGWGDVHFWQIDAASQRPWGLATLVTGAYGVVGFCIWGSITLVPWGIAAVRSRYRSAWPAGWPDGLAIRAFTVILLVHAIDAALNSGYWLPIVFCLGMVSAEQSMVTKNR